MDSDFDRLQLSTEEMRRLGHAVVDAIVVHFDGLADGPVGRRASPAELERLFREPIPEAPGHLPDLLERVRQDIFPNNLHVDHPRFFAFVPSPGNFVSAMADALVAGFNMFAGTWFAGSGAAQAELVVIDWLREMCGLPEGAGGLFVTGGTMANLTGLAAARHAKLGDSLSLDPHKWLFQNFELGCVLLRDGNLLRDTFQVMPEYLRDTERGLEEVNFGNRGVQLTRSPRGLKLWMSLQVFGLRAFRNAIARGLRLAELAEQALRQSEDWAIVTPAQLAVVTF